MVLFVTVCPYAGIPLVPTLVCGHQALKLLCVSSGELPQPPGWAYLSECLDSICCCDPILGINASLSLCSQNTHRPEGSPSQYPWWREGSPAFLEKVRGKSHREQGRELGRGSLPLPSPKPETTLLFLKIYLFYMFKCFCLRLCIRTTGVPGAHGSQKRASDPLGLE